MKIKAPVITDMLLLLSISVVLVPLLTEINAVEASEASIIWHSTAGASWYETNTTWTNETNVAIAVCDYIEDAFDDYRNYARLDHYFNTSVTQSNIFAVTDDCDGYDYATVFNYAHGGYTSVNGWYVPWGYPPIPIPVTHYRYFAYDGSVYDYVIHYYTDSATHQFVFLWTCAQAEEIGYYDESWEDGYGRYYGTGAVGMSFAWTQQDENDLSDDGYDDPDSTDYCVIAFQGWSKPLSAWATYNHDTNYGDFVKKFYERALQDNRTFNQALDDASYYIWYDDYSYDSFRDTWLYNGYTDDVPDFGPWYGKMHVYGNGGNIFPQ